MWQDNFSSLKPTLPPFSDDSINHDDIQRYIDHYRHNTERAIDISIHRAEALWPFIERYIEAYSHESSGDLIVESIDIWPHLYIN